MAQRYANTMAGIGDGISNAVNGLAGVFMQAPRMAYLGQQANLANLNAQKIAGDVAFQQKQRAARDAYGQGVARLFQPQAQFADDGSSNMMPPLTGMQVFERDAPTALPGIMANANDAGVKPNEFADMMRVLTVANGGNASQIARAFLAKGDPLAMDKAYSPEDIENVNRRVRDNKIAETIATPREVGAGGTLVPGALPADYSGPNFAGGRTLYGAPTLATEQAKAFQTLPNDQKQMAVGPSQGNVVGRMLLNESGLGGGTPAPAPATGPMPGQPGVSVGGQAAMPGAPAPAAQGGGGLSNLSPAAQAIVGTMAPAPNPQAAENDYMKGTRDKTVETITTNGANADGILNDIGVMKKQLDDGLKTGTFAPARLFTSQFLESIGFNPDTAKSLTGMTAAGGREFESAANTIVAQITKQFDSRPTDRDLAFINSTKASITDAPSAARAVLGLMEYKAQRDSAKAAAFGAYNDAKLGKPEQFQRTWNQLVSQVPVSELYAQSRQPGFEQSLVNMMRGGGQAQPAQTSANTADPLGIR